MAFEASMHFGHYLLTIIKPFCNFYCFFFIKILEQSIYLDTWNLAISWHNNAFGESYKYFPLSYINGILLT